MSRHVVARVGEIAPGAVMIVTVEGREIGVFNVNGAYFGLINRCPHEGAPLCRGKVTGFNQSDEPGQYRLTRPGELLRCPWHGWEFDIRTGQSWCEPDRVKARRYDVQVARGETLVEGPFKAETFPVSIDEDYLVIEI